MGPGQTFRDCGGLDLGLLHRSPRGQATHHPVTPVAPFRIPGTHSQGRVHSDSVPELLELQGPGKYPYESMGHVIHDDGPAQDLLPSIPVLP